MNRLLHVFCLATVCTLLAACSSAANGSADNSSASSDASSASTSDAASSASDAASPAADAASPGSDASSEIGTPAASDAIKKFVAGEDSNFADIKGSLTKQNGGMSFYSSSLGLPGAAECAVYKYDKTGDWYVNCFYPADTEAKAHAIEAQVIDAMTKAESGWTVVPVKPLPAGNLSASMVRDPSNQHGVYIYTDKAADGSYRVDVTFGTTAALRA